MTNIRLYIKVALGQLNHAQSQLEIARCLAEAADGLDRNWIDAINIGLGSNALNIAHIGNISTLIESQRVMPYRACKA